MIPFLPGETADIRKLFHPLGRPKIEFIKCRVLKQVLYNSPAYRVSAIPGQWHDPDARHYSEWDWVVDGTWMTHGPFEASEEVWELLSTRRTMTVSEGITAFRNVEVGGQVKWKSASSLFDLDFVRNGSPFGRVGRKTQVVQKLPSDNFLSDNHGGAYGYVKRFQWLKNNSILVSTDTIAIRKTPSGGWEWVVGLTKLSRSDNDERLPAAAQAMEHGLTMKTHEDGDEKSTSIAQASMGDNREGGNPECMGTSAGGESSVDTEGNLPEGGSPVGIQEEGDDPDNMQDVREVED